MWVCLGEYVTCTYCSLLWIQNILLYVNHGAELILSIFRHYVIFITIKYYFGSHVILLFSKLKTLIGEGGGVLLKTWVGLVPVRSLTVWFNDWQTRIRNLGVWFESWYWKLKWREKKLCIEIDKEALPFPRSASLIYSFLDIFLIKRTTDANFSSKNAFQLRKNKNTPEIINIKRKKLHCKIVKQK